MTTSKGSGGALTGDAREELLARTFVELADTSADFDPVRLGQIVANRCVELFDVSAAGVLLADAHGQLGLTGSTSADMRTAELFELRSNQGPCIDSYRTDQVVAAPDIARSRRRWARFAPVALDADFASVHAVPIRARDRVLGALNLFRAGVGNLDAADLLAASALATAIAITVLQQHDLVHLEARQHRREPGGDDRVVVEQAKGILAGQADITLVDALRRLRRYANYHNLPLNSVCRQVVAGTLTLATASEIAERQRRRSGP